jgi:hypothetical protein
MLKTLLSLLTTATIAAVASAGEADLPRPPRDQESGRFLYQEVITVEGVGAAELYSRARAWLATAYRSAKDVIQLDDAAAGRLIARGNFGVTYYMSDAWVRHTLTIEVKDGRFRYNLTDFVFDNGHWSASLEEEKKFTGQKKKLFTQVIAQAGSTIADLKGAMSKASPVGTDEW